MRRTGKPRITGDWKPKFLVAFSNSGNVRYACREAGVARSTAYEAKESDPEFSAAWDVANEEATERLELVAYNRAVRSSDRLLEFLLKARKPDKYRDRLEIEASETTEVFVDLVPLRPEGGE